MHRPGEKIILNSTTIKASYSKFQIKTSIGNDGKNMSAKDFILSNCRKEYVRFDRTPNRLLDSSI